MISPILSKFLIVASSQNTPTPTFRDDYIGTITITGASIQVTWSFLQMASSPLPSLLFAIQDESTSNFLYVFSGTLSNIDYSGKSMAGAYLFSYPYDPTQYQSTIPNYPSCTLFQPAGYFITLSLHS